MKHPVCDAASFAAATGATAAQMADIESFRELLKAESRAFNLVGPSFHDAFWSRHAFDSVQLLALAPRALRWADIGAGAGFPGIMLAIMLKGASGAEVHLVESQQKRARFLQSVVSRFALPATVHAVRAEGLAPVPACEVVTARACAPLPRLFDYTLPFFRAGAVGLFLKGRHAEDEVRAARLNWRFQATMIGSRSDPEGRVARIEGLRRVGAVARRAGFKAGAAPHA